MGGEILIDSNSNLNPFSCLKSFHDRKTLEYESSVQIDDTLTHTLIIHD